MSRVVFTESVTLKFEDRVATATLLKGDRWTVHTVSEDGQLDRRDHDDSFATREEAIAKAHVVWGVKK